MSGKAGKRLFRVHLNRRFVPIADIVKCTVALRLPYLPLGTDRRYGKQRAAVQQTPFLMSATRSKLLSPNPNKPSIGIHGVSG